jgi:type I restriction-modification system DNA methylase subunit
MTNRMIGIYNGETDTYIQREATNAEQAEIDATQAQVAVELAEQEAMEKELKSAKEAILAKIGLTQEEATILLTPEPAKPIVK